MFTKDEATKERVAQYHEALQAEQASVEQALEQEKAAENEPRVKRLEKRLAAVKAELGRVEKLKPKK